MSEAERVRKKMVCKLMNNNLRLEEQVKQLTEYNKLLRAAYDHVESQLREDGMGGLCDSISEFHKNQAE